MTEELGMKEMLSKILDEQKEIKEQTKQKGFKLPWKAKIGRKKAQKGWATIQVIRDNGEISFVRKHIEAGVVEIEGFPRVATVNHKLSYKGKPFYIIPTWSMKPFSPTDNYAETEKEKMNIAGRRAVLSALETEKIKGKKDFGNAIWAIWIILIAAIVGIGWYFGKQWGWF